MYVAIALGVKKTNDVVATRGPDTKTVWLIVGANSNISPEKSLERSF